METFILHLLVGTIGSFFIYLIFMLLFKKTEIEKIPLLPGLIGLCCALASSYISHFATPFILVLFSLALVREYQLSKIYYVPEIKKKKRNFFE